MFGLLNLKKKKKKEQYRRYQTTGKRKFFSSFHSYSGFISRRVISDMIPCLYLPEKVRKLKMNIYIYICNIYVHVCLCSVMSNCDFMNCSPPTPLSWVAISYSREASWTRDVFEHTSLKPYALTGGFFLPLCHLGSPYNIYTHI